MREWFEAIRGSDSDLAHVPALAQWDAQALEPLVEPTPAVDPEVEAERVALQPRVSPIRAVVVTTVVLALVVVMSQAMCG